MKFFADTTDIKKIRELNDVGFLDSVTTYLSLILGSGGSIAEVAREICFIVGGSVSDEAEATDHKNMMCEAGVLAKIADNICTKALLTLDGLTACKPDQALFDAVQAKLNENRLARRATNEPSQALLFGKLYDDRGDRMTPSYAIKKGFAIAIMPPASWRRAERTRRGRFRGSPPRTSRRCSSTRSLLGLMSIPTIETRILTGSLNRSNASLRASNRSRFGLREKRPKRMNRPTRSRSPGRPSHSGGSGRSFSRPMAS